MTDSHVVGFDTKPEAQTEIYKNSKSSKKGGGFQSLSLSFAVQKGLQKRGYKTPTPIQRKSIPLLLQGRDVVAMARTGSGKTACFLVPMLEKLIKKPAKSTGPRALILSPTRELAIQTLKFIRELGRFTNLKSVVVLGGDSMDQQFGALHGKPDIIVATPGRFLHLCVEMDFKLNSVDYVVFDEADRLFEMGFGEQLREIVSRLPESRQTALFSATLPKLLVEFAKAGLNNPVLLRLDVESKLPDGLETAFFAIRTEDKPAALLSLVQALPLKSQILVFAATKHHVEYIHMLLDKSDISNTYIYSDLDPSARKINAAKFQNGNCRVLVVTDVAARGVDIPQLDYVINYHFPAKSKLFVHRVGRCARAGRSGSAFSLVSAEESAYVLDLHLFLGKPLCIVGKTTLDDADNKDGLFGRIPECLIEAEQSEIIIWHENDADLFGMKKVCSNAYKKYLSSRPGASVESVRRLKGLDLVSPGIHPMFSEKVANETETLNLLDRMKNYKPKGTVFELNVSAKSKSYSIMKNMKKSHERQILNFRIKKSEKVESTNGAEGKPLALKESDEMDIQSTFPEIVLGKRKNQWVENKKTKKRKFIDEDNYVPHLAPDRYTEGGLSLNNFTAEANNASLDLTHDSAEGLKVQKRLRKWDKVKKKMVTLPGDKMGKIKTESGNWISATYKGNRYAQWKQKAKAGDDDEDDEDDNDESENDTAKNVKKRDFPNTHWGRHNRKMAEKLKAKARLKRPEQILKERKELQRRRQKSIPKSKRKMFNNKNKKK